MEKVDNEFVNQLKYMIDNFSCEDKRFEDGFIGGLFYVLTWIQYGKSYADHKINWDKIGREANYDGKDSIEPGSDRCC